MAGAPVQAMWADLDGADGRRSVELVQAIYASARSGGGSVTIQL
jgi:hypothetical protein